VDEALLLESPDQGTIQATKEEKAGKFAKRGPKSTATTLRSRINVVCNLDCYSGLFLANRFQDRHNNYRRAKAFVVVLGLIDTRTAKLTDGKRSSQ